MWRSLKCNHGWLEKAVCACVFSHHSCFICWLASCCFKNGVVKFKLLVTAYSLMWCNIWYLSSFISDTHSVACFYDKSESRRTQPSEKAQSEWVGKMIVYSCDLINWQEAHHTLQVIALLLYDILFQIKWKDLFWFSFARLLWSWKASFIHGIQSVAIHPRHSVFTSFVSDRLRSDKPR